MSSLLHSTEAAAMQLTNRILRSPRRAALTIAALCSTLAVGGVALNTLNAAGDEGCQPVPPSSITESERFTPYEDRLTHLRDHPINKGGLRSASRPVFAPSTMDGLPISWVALAKGGFIEVFYLSEPFGPTMTRPGFFAAGGLIFLTYPADVSAGSHAYALQAELGERVTIVKVGQFDGALTWGDPMSNGVRPHQLSWSSVGEIHNLIGVRPAEAIVNLGRGAVC
jgi:hypothetical protein